MANNSTEAAVPSPAQEQQSSSSSNTNTNKPSLEQHSVTLIYETNLLETCGSVMVTWNKNPTDHSLTITMETETPSEHHQNTPHTCKIDSISKWGKKGLKTLEIQGNRVDLFWDFRNAKFSSDPQPHSHYYVAMVYRKEMLLLLGDMEKEAHERTRSNPYTEEAILVCKKETVYGKKLFCTRAMLEEGKTEHDVVIETSLCGPGDPEMWVSIDGVVATRIMNLNWRFRGNETVIVNNLPVEIMWDVHDWLFNGGSGHGLFIFKPGCLESRDCSGERSSCSEEGFCHFLYAWITS